MIVYMSTHNCYSFPSYLKEFIINNHGGQVDEDLSHRINMAKFHFYIRNYILQEEKARKIHGARVFELEGRDIGRPNVLLPESKQMEQDLARGNG